MSALDRDAADAGARFSATSTEAKVSAWALVGLALFMVLGAVVLFWVAVQQLGFAMLLLVFSGYLLHRATVIFGFFVVGGEPKTLEALVEWRPHLLNVKLLSSDREE